MRQAEQAHRTRMGGCGTQNIVWWLCAYSLALSWISIIRHLGAGEVYATTFIKRAPLMKKEQRERSSAHAKAAQRKMTDVKITGSKIEEEKRSTRKIVDVKITVIFS
jgi:hypothetical protein